MKTVLKKTEQQGKQLTQVSLRCPISYNLRTDRTTFGGEIG